VVRALIASALGELGPKGQKAIAPLIETLKDRDPYVRVATVQALGEIGQFHPAACEGPVRAVFLNGDEEETVRAAAAEALKKIAGVPK
jgi:HEAT repeat protein